MLLSDDPARAFVPYSTVAVPNAPEGPLAGLTFGAKDIFDVAEVAGFFNYTNRVAHAVDMMPNPEYHDLARRGPPSASAEASGDTTDVIPA